MAGRSAAGARACAGCVGVTSTAALNVDEQLDLVTLTWMGRGDGDLGDWYELRDTAAGEHSPRTTVRYLLGNPLLGDHLADGLALFGRSCAEFADQG